MKNLKRIFAWTPEIYFILFACWWARDLYLIQQIVNYPAILLICVLILQFFIRNRTLGLTVSTLLGLASAYLILALWSDLAKEPGWDEGAIRFLLTAGLLIATNITMSVFMFHKNYSKKNPSSTITAEQ